MTKKDIQDFMETFEERLCKGIFPNSQVVDCSVIAELAGECLDDYLKDDELVEA